MNQDDLENQYPALAGRPLTKEELDALPAYVEPKPHWIDLYHFDGKEPVKIGQFDWNYWGTHGGMFSSKEIDFGNYYFKDDYPGRTLIAKYNGTYDAADKLEIVRLFCKKDREGLLYEKDEQGNRYGYMYVTDKPLEVVREINEIAKPKRPFFREVGENET